MFRLKKSDVQTEEKKAKRESYCCHQRNKEDGDRLFLKVQCLRIRSSEHKQQYGKFFCAVKMAEYQNRLLRQLSPSLEILKT